MSWLSQPSAILLFATTKTSIAILTLRLIGRTTFWRKHILHGIIALVCVANFLGVVFTFAQRKPGPRCGRRAWRLPAGTRRSRRSTTTSSVVSWSPPEFSTDIMSLTDAPQLLT